jgi:hypothetical protein
MLQCAEKQQVRHYPGQVQMLYASVQSSFVLVIMILSVIVYDTTGHLKRSTVELGGVSRPFRYGSRCNCAVEPTIQYGFSQSSLFSIILAKRSHMLKTASQEDTHLAINNPFLQKHLLVAAGCSFGGGVGRPARARRKLLQHRFTRPRHSLPLRGSKVPALFGAAFQYSTSGGSGRCCTKG